MSWLLTVISGAILGKQVIDEKRRPVIPAENWRNKDLIYEDRIIKCMSFEQYMTNLTNGKYYLPDVPPNAVIDDMEKYKKDSQYDFMRAYKAAINGEYKAKSEVEPVDTEITTEYVMQKYNCSESLAKWLKLLEEQEKQMRR